MMLCEKRKKTVRAWNDPTYNRPDITEFLGYTREPFQLLRIFLKENIQYNEKGTKEKNSDTRKGLQFCDGVITVFWWFDIFDQPNN